MSIKRTPKSRCIGDYIPIKTLGTGATGKVKLARHVETGQYVALKIIRKQLLDGRYSLYQQVKREIAVMKLISGSCRHVARLSSTRLDCQQAVGVLNLLDVYETDACLVLVLEYCEGGELFDVLVESCYFPEPKVLDYFQQLVYALEFCHNRGVCHRDLKPENVLLTADGQLKLADFGLSGLLSPGCLLETSCGSPQYSAPEVISGESYEGCPADIWSLGAVLFAMATGGLPFHDDNITRLINKIQAGAFYIPPAVPTGVAELIKSMLVVDPSKRATIQDIKNSEWFQSRECRTSVYKDEQLDFNEFLAVHSQYPIEKPDPKILRYLADLGLGDIPTIERRLRSPDRCLERDYYYQLDEFCYDSLAFRPVQEVPMSPRSRSTAGSPSSIQIVPPKLSLELSEQLQPSPLPFDEETADSTPPITSSPSHNQTPSTNKEGQLKTEPEKTWFSYWASPFVPRNTSSPVTITAVSAVELPLSQTSALSQVSSQ